MRSCMSSALFTFKMPIIRRPGYACTCHTCYQEHMIDYPVLFQVFILHLETNILIHCELHDGKLEDKPGMSSMRSVMQTTCSLTRHKHAKHPDLYGKRVVPWNNTGIQLEGIGAQESEAIMIQDVPIQIKSPPTPLDVVLGQSEHPAYDPEDQNETNSNPRDIRDPGDSGQESEMSYTDDASDTSSESESLNDEILTH